jgi:hypothetical protein
MCQSYCDQQVLGCLVVVSSAVGLHRRMLIMRTKLDWYLLWRVLLYKICFEQYIFCEINGISLFKKGNFGICRSMRDGDLIADPYEYFDIILIISFFCCWISPSLTQFYLVYLLKAGAVNLFQTWGYVHSFLSCTVAEFKLKIMCWNSLAVYYKCCWILQTVCISLNKFQSLVTYLTLLLSDLPFSTRFDFFCCDLHPSGCSSRRHVLVLDLSFFIKLHSQSCTRHRQVLTNRMFPNIS